MEHPPIDIVWVVISAGLVFLMQAGFMCLESGLTRAKNSINVAIKNIADFGISVFLFWAFGFALMFGLSKGGWIGTTHLFPAVSQGGPWLAAFFVFEAMFCGTVTTIVSGAVAERMRFGGYLAVAIILSGLIYTLFGHWVWGGMYAGDPGWLAQLGFVDFAGSTVVHGIGGWVALAAVIVIGPREGRFPDNGPPGKIHGHDLPMAILGTLLLWLGWFGFNGGSTMAMSDQVPGIIVNTIMAGVTGMVMTLVIGWLSRGRPDVGLLINGSLAGLVAITASANAVSTLSAVIIGGVGGVIMIMVTQLLERLRIDDVVGAIPVHAGAGMWGTLAVALFGSPEVLGTGLSRAAQLGVQLLGTAVSFVWAFGVVYLVLRVINWVFPLRVSSREEYVGLNVSEHGATTELLDLFRAMDDQAKTGDLRLRVAVEPFTEVGQIAVRYNLVMDALERAVAQTEAIVRSVTDAIITFSKESFAITSVNPSAVAMFGYPEGQILGAPVTLLLGSDESQPGGAAAREVDVFLPCTSATTCLEIVGKRANGSVFPAEVTVAEADMDQASFYTGTFRDITERKRLQDQEAAYMQQLQTFNATLEQRIYEATAKITDYNRLLEGQLGEIKAMSEVALAINSVMDVHVVLEMIMDKSKEVMQAEASSLLLIDKDSGKLRFQVARGMAGAALQSATVELGRGIAGWVAQTAQPLLVPDAYQDPRFDPSYDARSGFHTRSLLTMPLKAKDEVLGVVQVINKIGQDAFDEHDLNLFFSFASQASVALENARLYEQTKAMAEDLREALEKERWLAIEKEKMGAYIPKHVVDEISRNREQQLALGGKIVRLTILFSDIRGFTRLSETLEPQKIVSFLNVYMTAMTTIIEEEGGIIDKFIGDGIMAIFAPQDESDNHALRAVRSGIRMQQKITELRQDWQATRSELMGLQVRVGINTGEVVAGNIGSQTRMDYTVVGDNVNVASRIETACRPDGVYISESTYDDVQDCIEATRIEPLSVKNRVQPVQTYALHIPPADGQVDAKAQTPSPRT